MHIGWTHVAELPPVDPSVPAIELTTRKIVPAEGDANRARCGIECCHICRAHPTNGFGMAAPATGTRESGLRLRDVGSHATSVSLPLKRLGELLQLFN